MKLRNGVLGGCWGWLSSQMALDLQQPCKVWILSMQVTTGVEYISLTFLRV